MPTLSTLALAVAPIDSGSRRSISVCNRQRSCFVSDGGVRSRSSVGNWGGVRSSTAYACHDCRHSPIFRESLAVSSASVIHRRSWLHPQRVILSTPLIIRTVSLAATTSTESLSGSTAGRFGRFSLLLVPFALNPLRNAASRAIFPVAKVGLTVQRKIAPSGIYCNKNSKSPPYR